MYYFHWSSTNQAPISRVPLPWLFSLLCLSSIVDNECNTRLRSFPIAVVDNLLTRGALSTIQYLSNHPITNMHRPCSYHHGGVSNSIRRIHKLENTITPYSNTVFTTYSAVLTSPLFIDLDLESLGNNNHPPKRGSFVYTAPLGPEFSLSQRH